MDAEKKGPYEIQGGAFETDEGQFLPSIKYACVGSDDVLLFQCVSHATQTVEDATELAHRFVRVLGVAALYIESQAREDAENESLKKNNNTDLRFN